MIPRASEVREFLADEGADKRARLVEKLLALMSMDETVRSAVDTIFAQIQAQFAQSTEAEQEAKELFESFRARSAKVDFKALLEEGFIRIYAKYFTEKELEDLIAFYSTPTGRKSIDVMSDLMREGMQLGGEELGPKIDEIMAEVTEEFEKKRPWRRTMMDLRTIAVALEAYAIDNETYPQGDFDALKPLLEPTYIRTLPQTDIWGQKYAYVVSSDRARYRLVSAGSDSIFEWDSRRIGERAAADVARIRAWSRPITPTPTRATLTVWCGWCTRSSRSSQRVQSTSRKDRPRRRTT